MAADLTARDSSGDIRLVPLVMLGFGNVGKAFARLLLDKESELIHRQGLALRVVGIGTGSHGLALDPAGLDLAGCLEAAEADRSIAPFCSGSPPADNADLLRRSAAQALLESTPVVYQTGQPAIELLETALNLGMHAVTANKGPVLHAYRRLSALAAQQQRKFRFESAVMDGAPVFSLWRSSLPAARLQSFRGILNSTTNFVLGEMEQGRSLEQAVGEAQQIGLAETDPSGDLEGWDAAIKVAALVNVLMDHPLTLDQVERQGILELEAEAVQQAAEAGMRWKLVCGAERSEAPAAAEPSEESVRARVTLERIGPEDPLYGVSGSSSAVTFVTDVLGDLTLTENDPGPRTTAYGMLADLLDAVG